MKIHVSTASGARAQDRPGRTSETRTSTRTTEVSYKETPSALDLKIDMAGVDAAGLDLTLKGRRLTVRHEKKSEARSQDARHERVETVREVRSKEIELPTDVDPDNIDAVFKDGVLHVKLAKLGARS